MKAFQKLKDWKASGFRLSDKTKYRLQGGAVGGALASVLLIASALAIGACSQNATDAKAEESTHIAPVTLGDPVPMEAFPSNSLSFYVLNPYTVNASSYNIYFYVSNSNYVTRDDYGDFSLSGTSWVSLQQFGADNGYDGVSNSYLDVISRGVSYVTFNIVNTLKQYNYFRPVFKANSTSYWYPSYAIETASLPSSFDGLMLDFAHMTKQTSVNNMTNVLGSYTDCFVPLSDVFLTASSSSEGSSSSSEESTTSSEEGGQPVGSLDEGAYVTLPDVLPFSAWVTNPLTQLPASNYDGGASFLLYTGEPNPTDGSGLPAQYVLYDVGEFYIDGVPQSFDQIGITTLALTGDEPFAVGGDTLGIVSASQVSKGAFTITGVRYVNSTSGASITVMKMGSTRIESNGQTYNALIGAQWLNAGFRRIRIVDAEIPLEIRGLEASNGWWLEHNAIDASSSISSFVLGNASTGVFGLIGNAFVSIASIMGISVVPGLTIGTLMFIPLVVLLIMTIVKMVGK